MTTGLYTHELLKPVYLSFAPSPHPLSDRWLLWILMTCWEVSIDVRFVNRHLLSPDRREESSRAGFISLTRHSHPIYIHGKALLRLVQKVSLSTSSDVCIQVLRKWSSCSWVHIYWAIYAWGAFGLLCIYSLASCPLSCTTVCADITWMIRMNALQPALLNELLMSYASSDVCMHHIYWQALEGFNIPEGNI